MRGNNEERRAGIAPPAASFPAFVKAPLFSNCKQSKLFMTFSRWSAKKLLLLVGALLLCAIQSHAAPPSGYILDWSDEFASSSLDMTKWNHRALGPRNSAVNTTSAVSVTNGVLTITTYTEGGTNFTGMIGTENLYMPLYGYMEARIRFNDSPGEWSAFWMQAPTMGMVGDPHAYGTEIDIVEHRVVNANNKDIADTAVSNIHWDGYGTEHKTVGTGRIGSGLSTGWHLYAMEWRKNLQNFYYDGALIWAVTNSPAQDPVPPDAPVSQRSQYFILSSEVRDTNWAGIIPMGGYGSRAITTTTMNVDYVRSYRFSPPANGLPLDDAYVRNGTYANTSFGAETLLSVKLDAPSSCRETFLKFAVNDLGSDKRVFLRLVPSSVGSVGLNLVLEFVSDDSWSEGGLTWNNKPPGSGTILANLTGLTENVPVTVDVTTLALYEAARDEILSLRSSSTTSNSNAYVDFFSKESGISANRPTLLITNASAPVYTLAYNAGPNGSISGSSPQLVPSGGSGTAVTAVANPGYYFLHWSDGSSANPRFEINATNNVTVTANFSPIPAPVLSAANLGAGIVNISFYGIAGVSYMLERSPDLLAWTNVATNTAPAGGLIAHTIVTSLDAAYYRVRSN